eukprot:CAMPEP_0197644166 /NCGR_PEP_ID=MMETSP1338-20131121/17232_1 /TAXON_ID=43686 ORGANISM="Pelagodinium beii, Strain RCC1491" /NCGR_SAMPLE_ID=MMETSP1338 /ASSEMBLY_ACC=CAM_ASM_000754 /LENGTH=248 /DNA_ID=CAMNT_0043217511 /DNA_START=35 /DNA_END=777 /DNA_ORIENTATION=-
MKKFFGGKDNKQISDEHPTYVSPDGKTFAIWGMIYTMETITVIAQAFPSDRTEELMGRCCHLTGLDVRQRLVLAFLANGLWLPVFNNERFWAGLGIMAVYLAFLLSTYADLNVGTTEGAWERIAFTAGIAMNASWIVVAFAISIFFCSGLIGWQNEHGVAGSVPAAVAVILLVAGLGCQRAIVACDLAWAFVAAWALQGIFRMQTIPDRVRFPLSAMNSNLGTVAKASSLTVYAAMLLGAGLAIYEVS